ncbi:MAG: 50S ribosomal protein L4 [Bacteroidales bacterium]|nr:50S ribosomal protein L4 [Bacteroidales bacterium]
MELEIYQIDGKKTSRKIKLDDSIFGVEPNNHAIYFDAKQFMAGQRQGTHSTKERNAIVGSRKKIKRQKGTGTARMGDIKSPILRGGGRAFGPHPRDYSFKLNKKVKRLARKSALSGKAKDNNIMVLEDFSFENPKTKNFIDILNVFEVKDKKTMFVFPETDRNVFLSSRNLKKVKVVRALDLNTYDILNHNKLFLLESSIKEIQKMFDK